MKKRDVYLLFGTLTIGPLLLLPCQAQQLLSPKSPERQAWHASMVKTPVPKNGCFKASYPSTEWQEVACTTAPPYPLLPASGRRAEPNTVGGGSDDYVGLVSGHLSQAEGSFPIVSNATTSNAYSLQLNSNTFTSPACDSGCLGWQQFVFQSSGSLYMQYWLIGYGDSCPSNWNSYEGSCWMNSSSSANISSQPISNLAALYLTGEAAGGTDTVVLDSFTDAVGGDISAVGADSVLGLEQGWSQAEFNVFGNGGGDEVNLNSNASLVVQISLDNGTTNTPLPVDTSYTGETNNLSLTGTVCPYGGTTPMIQFLESDASGATATCGAVDLELGSSFVAPPSATNIKVTIEPPHPKPGQPVQVIYNATLEDSTPGATIYYQLLNECGDPFGPLEGISPGTTITVSGNTDGTGCNANLGRTSMYATASGYLQSPIEYFTF